jgi:hypothetical protein
MESHLGNKLRTLGGDEGLPPVGLPVKEVRTTLADLFFCGALMVLGSHLKFTISKEVRAHSLRPVGDRDIFFNNCSAQVEQVASVLVD